MLSLKRGSLLPSFTDLNLNFGSVTMPWANYIELEDLTLFHLYTNVKSYKRTINTRTRLYLSKRD